MGAGNVSGRGEAIAAWLTLTAPGALVTCAIIMLALLGAPRLTPLVIVSPAVRHVAATLLLLHVALTGVLALKPGQRLVALLFLGLLAADALLCGMLFRASHEGLAPLLACAVLVISLEAGGWPAAAMTVVATGAGAIAAAWWGIHAALFVPAAVSFPTTLAVETSFAGGAVVAAATAPALTFPTTLSVETWMGGTPALAAPEELFIPTLALVLAALCLGLTTSLWRVRKARTVVAASIVAAARVTT